MMTLEADGCITIYEIESGRVVTEYEGLELHNELLQLRAENAQIKTQLEAESVAYYMLRDGLRAENARLADELANWRNAFMWVEQHVIDIFVGFADENPIRVNWIDDNGNPRESQCEALLNLAQEHLRLAEQKQDTGQ